MRKLLTVLIAAFLLSATLLSSAPARATELDCSALDSPGCSFGLPTFQYQMLMNDMMAHPKPNVRPLETDPNELGKFAFYKLIGGATPLFNGPGGAQIETLDAGFNYVTVISRQGDWVQIFPNKWTTTNYLAATRASDFSGVLIDEELAYPMAWVLLPTKPSAVPGLAPAKETPIVGRYTRVNIFATRKVGEWEWYLIGPGQWLEQRRIARVLPTQRPEGVKGRWVAIDLYEQIAVAYEGDRMVFATLVSSGLPKWATNEGLFRIWARPKLTEMSGAMGRPDFYSLQAVPWVMYYDNDISIHGTYWHDGFGYRHSHGCVNMSITDAQWVYSFTTGFYADTWVYVWASGKY
jgi:hypothetical protein